MNRGQSTRTFSLFLMFYAFDARIVPDWTPLLLRSMFPYVDKVRERSTYCLTQDCGSRGEEYVAFWLIKFLCLKLERPNFSVYFLSHDLTHWLHLRVPQRNTVQNLFEQQGAINTHIYRSTTVYRYC